MKWIALSGLGIYLVLGFGLYLMQARMLFHPSAEPLEACQEARELGFRVVREGSPSEPLRFLFRENPHAKANLIIFHGNGSTACGSLYYYAHLKDMPFNFVLAAYPGYDGDENHHSSSEKLITQNALGIYDWVAKSTGSLPTYLFGESLGTGVSTFVASKRSCKALVLRAPYTSVADVAASHFPIFPVRWILKHPFPASEWVKEVRCPALLLHGTSDQTIPYRFGKKQAENFGTLGRLVTIHGAGHNDLADDREGVFWREARGFLRAQLGVQ